MHVRLSIIVAGNINNTIPYAVLTAVYGRMHTVFYGYFTPVNRYTPPTRPGGAGTVTATVLRTRTVPLYGRR